MRRDTWIKAIALLVLVLCMTASGVLTTQVATSVGQHRLVHMDRAEDGDPPEVALGIAMGAFRGMFVNMLWLRANELKEAGKYHEAIDLASTITKLQPRFPEVWVFHAWNLAYNISVATQTPEERWQWVQAGIRLLREQGIPANPNSILLHKELAWLHLHKIQGYMDDAHDYYKRRHAEEWTAVLGVPPRRNDQIRTREQLIDACIAWLRNIADAPDTLEAAIEKEPTVAVLVERLRRETGMGLDTRLLREVEKQRALFRMSRELEMEPVLDDEEEPFVRLGLDPELSDAWRTLVPFVRKQILRDRYRMEIDRMIRYTRKYGPLDWRHPAAHSLYWAARGVEEALLRVHGDNVDDFDFLNTDRMVIHSIQELYRTGSLHFDILNPDFYMAIPNADFIESYGTIIHELMERERITQAHHYDPRERVFNVYSAGYENFLRDAIRFLYRRGEREEAERYYQKLRTWPGQNLNNPMLVIEFQRPLSEFVAYEIVKTERFTVPQVALSEVVGSLHDAYLNGLRTGNGELFRSQINYARNFHRSYTERQVFDTAITRDIRARMEVMPRNFEDFAGAVLARLIEFAGLAEGRLMYQRAPDWLRAATYAHLEQGPVAAEFRAMARAQGQETTELNVWFPPPPGVDVYRQRIRAQQQRDAGQDLGRPPPR